MIELKKKEGKKTMAKSSTIFVCSNCGNESPKWFGKCPACNEWNTCYEEKQTVSKNGEKAPKREAKTTLLNDIKKQDIARSSTGFEELDRVLGGGLVKGSLTLLGRRTRYWEIYFNSTNM